MSAIIKRVFVLKHSAKGKDSGTVTPVAYEDSNGNISAVDAEKDYPPYGRIYISNNYEESIEKKYGSLQLFYLHYDAIDKAANYDEIVSTPLELQAERHSAYRAKGAAAKDLDASFGLPIIPVDNFPEIATGRIHLSLPDIGNKPFFIFKNNLVTGPFKFSHENEGVSVIEPYQNNAISLNRYHVGEFKFEELKREGFVLQVADNNGYCWFFTSLKAANEKQNEKPTLFTQKDYITDSELIKFFGEDKQNSKNAVLTKNEIRSLQNAVKEMCNKNRNRRTEERTIRIEKVLDSLSTSASTSEKSFFNEYLSTSAGKALLEALKSEGINTNFSIQNTKSKDNTQEDFLEKKREEELDLHNQRIKLLKEEIAFHDEYFKRKQDEVKELENKNTEEQIKELGGHHTELLAKIAEAENRLENLKILDDLTKEQDYLQRNIFELKKSVETQESIFETQKSLLQGEKGQVLKKAAIEFETVRTVLNGIPPEQKNELKPANLKKHEDSISEEGRKRYIRHLRDLFNAAEGRAVDYDETANLLLSTLQSYITILTGAPGTGKTSSVLNFSDAMGLRKKDKKLSETDNFLNISIGRGWTSSRDLLGFYNSLKNTYQPSRSGLYEFLKAFSDSETHLEQHLKLVLMDEANLSSIEHYWSDFLGWCDNIDDQHTLNLAPNSLLTVPKSLRFMATINNDATVESLSPRLIDRATIIKLDHKDAPKFKDMQSSIFSGAVPYEDLIKAFYPKNDDAELSDIEDYQLKEIQNILSSTQSIKGSPIYYSQRKINAITKYCYIANQLDFQKIEPLDFAISQHILPSISGHGEDLKKRLESLKDKLNTYGYSKSKKIVADILAAGDDLSHSYSFF